MDIFTKFFAHQKASTLYHMQKPKRDFSLLLFHFMLRNALYRPGHFLGGKIKFQKMERGNFGFCKCNIWQILKHFADQQIL